MPSVNCLISLPTIFFLNFEQSKQLKQFADNFGHKHKQERRGVQIYAYLGRQKTYSRSWRRIQQSRSLMTLLDFRFASSVVLFMSVLISDE